MELGIPKAEARGVGLTLDEQESQFHPREGLLLWGVLAPRMAGRRREETWVLEGLCCVLRHQKAARGS